MPLEFPGYRLDSVLHQGTRSLVYRALREEDKRPTILKILQPSQASTRNILRLQQEKELLSSLTDQGIIRSYDAEHREGIHALALEDFGGVSLKQVIASSRLDLLTFLRIASQLADALGTIHRNNIIHKDINSSNIVMNVETGQVKIIDFGIASRLSRENPAITNPTALEGTLSYISPEQTGRMNRGVDYRSDFYSLGISLYEALIGWLPFQSTDPLELIHGHIAKMPLPPSDLNQDIPKPVSDIVMKLISKTAEERYQSAAGLKADLDRCLAELQSHGRITSFVPGENDVSEKFQIPERLYGREPETRELMKSFERVCAGGMEVLVASGDAGIGKSALFNEVHKGIVRNKGFFISGKFDQLKRNIPYDSIIQAFRELTRQILTEPERRITEWKTLIEQAVGSNGQVITDVIPEIELIIGSQPPVQDLPPMESQNRFNRTFQHFVRVFASETHPLVLFLDDLQWADLASLNLIQLLLTDPENRYLLVLASYRDSDVVPTHPLAMAFEEIQAAGTPITRLTLEPLDVPTIERILEDTIRSDSKGTGVLAALIHRKTAGNPYFVTEFLKTLSAENLLRFDANARAWKWDLEEIQQKGITENVVTLMTEKIQKLEPETQDALKTAACIGNSFDLRTLAMVRQQSHGATADVLWSAIQQGLILPIGDSYKFVGASGGSSDQLTYQRPVHYAEVSYRFSHDRVQQAAYGLLGDNEKESTRLRIGRLLMKHLSPAELDDQLFTCVDHLNEGMRWIDDERERDECCALNVRAGVKAKASNAFEAALRYLRTGMDLLPDEGWDRIYDLALELTMTLGEVEYLNGHFEESERQFDTVIANSRSSLHTAQVYNIKVILYTNQGQFDRAIEAGIKGLRHLGVSIKASPSKLSVARELVKTRIRLRGKSTAELSNLPVMTDAAAGVALTILMNLNGPAYSKSQELFALIIFKKIELSLRHGNAPVSAYGYGIYGLLLGSAFGQYRRGEEYGKLALAMADRFDDAVLKGRTYFLVAATINHWTHHARTDMEYLQRAYRHSIESGDVLFALYGLTHFSEYNIYLGTQLDILHRDAGEHLEFSRRRKSGHLDHYFIVSQRLVLALKGLTESATSFSGEGFDEETYLRDLLKTNWHPSISMYYIVKVMLLVLNGAAEQALRTVSEGERFMLGGKFGGLGIPELRLFEALALSDLYEQSTARTRFRYRRRLESLSRQMKRWADNSPENFAHKHLLVSAEIARVTGRARDAMDLYDRAISEAQRNEYTHHEAITNERAGRFYLAEGKQHIARMYLAKAQEVFRRWGATGKVRQMESQYASALSIQKSDTDSRRARETTSDLDSTGTSSIDLMSVLKASQALSGEIVLSSLLQKLMRVVNENTGAEKGVLVMEKNGTLVIEGEGSTERGDVQVLQSVPVEESRDLPVSILQYVARTKENVVLHDASREGLFTSDSYVIREKPKSILCVPILHHGSLTGILYFENNLTTGAFTPERYEVLRLLSTQIAISIENARLLEQEKTLVRIQEEVRLASRIQQDLLPTSMPDIIGYQIAGRNIPAQQVGGDYYDFIQIDAHRWAICIGDVSGKGLPASLLMANLQATLRGQTLLHVSPKECLERANTLLYQSTSPDKFATLFYGILDTTHHTFHFANAGHDHPIVLNQGVITSKLKTGGIPLGMLPEYAYEEERIDLRPGDTIVMTSDGVSEAMNEEDELYGEGRLEAVVREHAQSSPANLVEQTLGSIRAFTGKRPQSDDVTMVVLHRRP